MRKTFLVLALVGVLVGLVAAPALARGEGNPHDTAVVYVTSQELYYDTIVLGELPYNGKGNWQKLEMTDDGLQTEFGPGDPGHFGGRWWVDVNGNGQRDSGDAFFLCPLLGPGRTTA